MAPIPRWMQFCRFQRHCPSKPGAAPNHKLTDKEEK